MAAKKKATEDFVMVNGIKCTTAAPLVELDKMIPYEKNAKVHGPELEILKGYLTNPEIGFRSPIELDGDMIIVAGHGRRQAAMELGMDRAPCIIHKDMHGEASDVYRLGHNKTSDLSGYDFDILDFEVARLNGLGWDMPSLGFEDMGSFDEEQQEDIEAPDQIDYVEVVDGPGDVAPDYKMMVHCSTYEELAALYKKLSEDGVDCQMLD